MSDLLYVGRSSPGRHRGTGKGTKVQLQPIRPGSTYCTHNPLVAVRGYCQTRAVWSVRGPLQWDQPPRLLALSSERGRALIGPLILQGINR